VFLPGRVVIVSDSVSLGLRRTNALPDSLAIGIRHCTRSYTAQCAKSSCRRWYDQSGEGILDASVCTGTSVTDCPTGSEEHPTPLATTTRGISTRGPTIRFASRSAIKHSTCYDLDPKGAQSPLSLRAKANSIVLQLDFSRIVDKISKSAMTEGLNVAPGLISQLASDPLKFEADWNKIRSLDFVELLQERSSLLQKRASLACRLDGDFEEQVCFTASLSLATLTVLGSIGPFMGTGS
jgi:hypothetical protein